MQEQRDWPGLGRYIASTIRGELTFSPVLDPRSHVVFGKSAVMDTQSHKPCPKNKRSRYDRNTFFLRLGYVGPDFCGWQRQGR